MSYRRQYSVVVVVLLSSSLALDIVGITVRSLLEKTQRQKHCKKTKPFSVNFSLPLDFFAVNSFFFVFVPQF